MDKDHRLDAPDNEALSAISQLDDHSELTTIYRRAHSEWEGVDIMSRGDREEKLKAEKLRISLSLRKWFVVIGLLIPLPFIILSLFVTFAGKYFDIETLGFMTLPLMIGIGFTLFLSYRGFKYAYKIFYLHGTKALPFILSLIALLGLSLNGLFLLTEPLHTGDHTIDSLIVAGAVLITSVIYSAIMTFVWSSPRLSSGLKIACVGILALIVSIGTAVLYLT